MSVTRRRPRIDLLALAIAATMPAIATADIREWDGGGGTNTSWTNPLNWDLNQLPAFDGTEDVVLKASGTASPAIPINNRYLINSLTQHWSVNAFTLSGTGPLVLNSGDLTRVTNSAETTAWSIYTPLILRNTGTWANYSQQGINVYGLVSEENGSHGIINKGYDKAITLFGGHSLTGDLMAQDGLLAIRSNAGKTVGTARGVADGGILAYIYDSGGTNLAHDNSDLYLRAGVMKFQGAANSITSETVNNLVFGASGSLQLNVGHSAYDKTPKPFLLNVTDITREGRAVGGVLATDSGLGKELATNAYAARVIASGNTPALVGGGGAAGTNTISIIPWLFSSWGTPDGADFTPDTFLTYDTRLDSTGKVLGLRALNPYGGELATTLAANSDTDQNVRLRQTSASITSPTALNALQVDRSTVSGASTLKIESGAMILYQSTISTATLDFGNREGIIWAYGQNLTPSIINSQITGTNGLTLTSNGFGVLELRGTGNYTGVTTLSSLTLKVAGDSSFGSGDIHILGTSANEYIRKEAYVSIQSLAASGTLNLTKKFILDSNLALGGGNLQVSGPIVLTGNRVLTLASTTPGTVSSVISESTPGASLTLSGSNVHLSGASTYTGKTIIRTGSELYIDGDVLPNVAGPLGKSTQPVQLGDTTQWGTSKLYLSNGSTFGRDLTVPYFQNIYNYPHRIGINAPGSATVTSNVTLRQNPLELWATANSTLNFEGTVSRAAGYTQAPSIRIGAYSLAAGENANGTVVLRNQSALNADIWSYRGTTKVVGDLFTPGRMLWVNEGARLTGSGNIRGFVTLADDGTDVGLVGAYLAPGDGVGTLEMTSLTLGNRTVYEWELGSTRSLFDTIHLTNAPAVPTNITLKITSTSGLIPAGEQFPIMSWDFGTISAPPTWTLDFGTSNFPASSVIYDATNKQFLLAVTPEPGVTALLLTVSAAALMRRARRK